MSYTTTSIHTSRPTTVQTSNYDYYYTYSTFEHHQLVSDFENADHRGSATLQPDSKFGTKLNMQTAGQDI
jgi:hypothetical protein